MFIAAIFSVWLLDQSAQLTENQQVNRHLGNIL